MKRTIPNSVTFILIVFAAWCVGIWAFVEIYKANHQQVQVIVIREKGK